MSHAIGVQEPTLPKGFALARASVEVPASIANLGAGYDCLGLAVDLQLTVTAEARPRHPDDRGVELTVDGEGAGELVADATNHVVVGLATGLTELGVGHLDDVSWRLHAHSQIPLARGLGSSAAATVAGLRLAESFAGRSLGSDALLALAAGLEGHPDNVAPALLGGLVASVALDGRVEAVRLDPPAGLEIVAWIPDRRLPTADMRAILPSSIPRADAVANLARVAVAIAGLAEGRADAMRLLGGDRLHEPYRSVPYPELPILVDAALAAGATSACLAGSGSTIVAFVAGPDDEVAARVEAGMREAAGETGLRGRSARLHPRSSGARGLP